MTSDFGDLNSTISLINDVMSSPDYTQLGVQSPGRRVNQQALVRRVLEELLKVANVVMQFTRRYNDTGLLPVLVVRKIVLVILSA